MDYLPEEQILRACTGIGACWVEPPPEVIALWDQGWLRRDDVKPYTFTTVEGAVDDNDD